uniref:HL07889p n=1 Tax=Drosophila melanogaster TaxID=7227 RepID=Q95RY5_DROME|nr:HL07889p [Drosophila melanogaster]
MLVSLGFSKPRFVGLKVLL